LKNYGGYSDLEAMDMCPRVKKALIDFKKYTKRAPQAYADKTRSFLELIARHIAQVVAVRKGVIATWKENVEAEHSEKNKQALMESLLIFLTDFRCPPACMNLIV